ncbi:MAG: serine/threonine protein kinase [Planctomycetota bacterium]|nr:serine/threonine protein kinase [Planctomycetota bacterium]
MATPAPAAAGSDPLIGALIGAIRIHARLGAGAMGVVYRGRHEVLNRAVAVKVLGAVHGDAERARQRFLREGQAAAKVSHPHVVQVLEAGFWNGQPYLVMELVNGHSLGRLLDVLAERAGKPVGLPAEQVVRLATGIALGLHAIHQAGIVHRDIKPDNILVAEDRTPKIADLGLAKEVAAPEELRLTGTGMVVGTPLYCAPEAIRDPQSIGPAADIYSFGVTLFHMLSGRPPFQGDHAYSVMRAHIEDRPPPLRALAPETPPWLVELVEWCLEKDPRRRPTALQVAEALAQGRVRRGLRRAGLVAVAAAGLAASALGAAVAWWALRAPPSSAAVVAPSATLRLESPYSELRVRVAGGPWQPVPEAGLALPPGRHRLEVRSEQPGPWRRWQGDCELVAGGTAVLAVDLVEVPVPELRLAMPGSGMLYVAGEAVGLESAFSVARAGRWPLARWEGPLWRTRTWEVDEQGQARLVAEATLPQPDGEARWKRSDRDGRPLPPHHIVCWWEAERIRREAGLLEPPGWQEQALRPAQPALRLRLDLVEAILARLAPVAAPPDRSAALGFSAGLKQPLWYRDGRGQLAVLGGSSGITSGALVVVPAPR